MRIQTKRVYEKAARKDGHRVLVDRMWPRGLKKEEANVDRWLRDLAPSTELRRWFGHDPTKWEQFKDRYFQELEENEELIDELRNEARRKTVTLLFAARDADHNNAVALQEYMTSR